jgi:hypothetical protein
MPCASQIGVLFCVFVGVSLPAGQEVSQTDLERWWEDLKSSNFVVAYRAVGNLKAEPVTAVPFLDQRLQPSPASNVPAQRVTQLIKDLGNQKFAERQKAERELAQLKDLAEEEMKKALAAMPELEIRLRVERLLAQLDLGSRPALVQELRAIHVLESVGTPEAKRVLQKLADGEPQARQTREAKASLQRLEGREKQMP